MKHFHGKSVLNFQPDQTTSCNRISQDAFLLLLFVFSRLYFDKCLTVRTNTSMCYPVFSERTRRKNDNSRVLTRLSLQLQTAWHRMCFW